MGNVRSARLRVLDAAPCSSSTCVLRDLRARGLRGLRGLRRHRLRRRRRGRHERWERWSVLPRANLEPPPADRSAVVLRVMD